jgi:hypothetical protein
MDYLKNNICKFTPLFNIDYKKKKNLICSSLFKLKNSYRSLNKYIDGVSIIAKHLKTKMTDYTLRLFIDQSIYNDSKIMEILLQIEGLEIVVYHCFDFIRDDIYHVGLFGTIVRMFPVFDFENNDANMILINDIDIDHQENIIHTEKVYNILKEHHKLNKLTLFNIGILSSASRLYFNVHNKLEYIYHDHINVYTLTDKICSIQRLPHELLTSFLKETLSNKSKFYSFYEYYKNSSHITEEMEQYIYGVDEYFVNKTLIPYVIDHKLPYATHIEWDIITTLIWAEITINSRFNKKSRSKTNKETLNEIKKILLKHDKKKQDTHRQIAQMSFMLDKHRINHTYYYKEILNLYESFILNYKNPDTKFIFTDEQYEILLNEFFGVYDLGFIRFYHTGDKDIITRYETFKEKDNKYLKKILNEIK